MVKNECIVQRKKNNRVE